MTGPAYDDLGALYVLPATPAVRWICCPPGGARWGALHPPGGARHPGDAGDPGDGG
jgi:hypothetical protein